MIELAIVKKHLRQDEVDDDDLILLYIKGALKAFETTCNRKLYEPTATIPEVVKNGINFDDSIQVGALLLIGHWYSNAEAVSVGTFQELPLGTQWQWQPHRFFNI